MVRRVSCGAYFSMALCAIGNSYTFGSDSYGELCRESSGSAPCYAPTHAAIQVPRLQQVAGGRAHTLLLTIGGRVFAAGRNNYGQLGLGSTTDRRTPERIGTSCITQVACGNNHSIAVTS